MTPRAESPPASSSNDPGNTDKTTSNQEENANTVVIHPPVGPPYVKCSSQTSFVNPILTEKGSPTEVNSKLNLNLGVKLLNPENKMIRAILQFISTFFVSWWEDHAFRAWNQVPLVVRQKITWWAWTVYFPLHKFLLKNKTGIHPSASYQYHALTSVMWWGRLFPVTVKRMRFSLSQLDVWHMRQAPYTSIYPISHDMTSPYYYKGSPKSKDEMMVTGYFVQKDVNVPSDKVVFWLYGGAYLAGDAKGNTTIAEKVAKEINADVFLPDYRLMPETDYDDILWDVVLAYIYLVQIRGIEPSNILLLGISSGGGLVTRLLQSLAEVQRNQGEMHDVSIQRLIEQAMKRFNTTSSSPPSSSLMPGGGVLVCPFVDYTDPKGRTLQEYNKHDLIVNQSVTEVGFPYFESKLGNDENRRRTSPVYRSFEDLPPLCVVVSEHEVVFDQTVDLVNKARSQNVPVTVGMWKYMCHVFCFLSSFVPEGEQSMDFVCDWMKKQYNNSDNNKNFESN